MPVNPDIRLYLLYYNPENKSTLLHSTALSKGRIGRVNLFADETQTSQNWVILAHELLHTLNATDKYNLHDNLPIFPEGYAEPEKEPLYPQTIAELMAGRIPLSHTGAEIPASLDYTMMGTKTAREIGWVKYP